MAGTFSSGVENLMSNPFFFFFYQEIINDQTVQQGDS